MFVHGHLLLFLFSHVHAHRMLTDIALARRDTNAARLEAGQNVVATSLSTEFKMSEDNIRRDLRALAVEGRSRRVYRDGLPPSAATATIAARTPEKHDGKL